MPHLRRQNTQLFALAAAPPQHITLRGRRYELAEVFKHDFFAATTLYKPAGQQMLNVSGANASPSVKSAIAAAEQKLSAAPNGADSSQGANSASPINIAAPERQLQFNPQFARMARPEVLHQASQSEPETCPQTSQSACPGASPFASQGELRTPSDHAAIGPALGASPSPALVVKFCRSNGFCGLEMYHLGRLLFERERAIHRRIDSVGGVQRWRGRVTGARGWAFALEYIEGRTLDTFDGAPSADFFDKLRQLIDRLHAVGLAYGDLNKRGNIIVDNNLDPVLIDFQISLLARRPERPSRLIRIIQRADIYHLYKHKLRMAPELMRPDEFPLAQRQSRAIQLHRRFYNPIKALRRRFLLGRRDAGLLVSPTDSLETTPHGETTCWRGEGEAPRAEPISE